MQVPDPQHFRTCPITRANITRGVIASTDANIVRVAAVFDDWQAQQQREEEVAEQQRWDNTDIHKLLWLCLVEVM